MDPANLFETKGTYKLVRLEYLVATLAVGVLAVIHIEDVRWWVALILFLYPDTIGYYAGAIAYRRSPDHRIPKAYYVLYNVAHSAITAGAVAGLWALLVGPEWAMLAIPLHLFGDRALFGNFMKPFSVDFEPEPHPVYARVKDLLELPPGEVDRAELDRRLDDVWQTAEPPTRLSPAESR